MSKQDINNFNFWCPVEISKAIDETTGEEIMLLGGIASTADEDSDGEFLDPNGFDIKPLLNSGMVNWHHQAKTCPATIVGEPVKAEIRKDGLYIETKLYPSSPIAREIWSLAQTLDRDSKTRRLGYSIEGKVLERKSNDKSSPDYKKISKAVITGVAITHQPKNPKTFANIIKGEIDDIDDDEEEDEEETADKKKNKRKETKEEREYYEGVGIEEKSLDTTAARPLIKEEVDPKLKVTTFGKAEVMERLFQDIPGISIEKAKKVYNLIKNISIMAKRVGVTEDDITKAYDALGLDMPQDITKGGDPDDDADVENDDSEEDDDDTVDNVRKAKKKPAVMDDDEEDDEPDDTEDDDDDAEDDDEPEDDDEDDEPEVTQKAVIFNRLERIEKAVATSHVQNARYIKALGVIVKDQSNQLTKAVDALNIAGNKIDELTDINKAQSDEIEMLKAQIEELGNTTPAPKSMRNVAAVERNFNKGRENDFGAPAENQVSVLNKAAISDILDQATFAKGGYDAEYSNALMGYESSGQVSQNIRQRIKSEFGIEII